jgi:hypothetical protein
MAAPRLPLIQKIGDRKRYEYRQPLAVTFLTIIGVAYLAACHKTRLTQSNQVVPPEVALKRFYENNGPEDTLMDPLILAGDGVVPLVLNEVKNKNMPRRRYAIGFLGNGSYKEALPDLEAILQDSAEEDYFRGDALQSIYMIDESRGKELAQNYQGGQNYLGEISRRIITGDSELKKRRTYSDALVGKHE